MEDVYEELSSLGPMKCCLHENVREKERMCGTDRGGRQAVRIVVGKFERY